MGTFQQPIPPPPTYAPSAQRRGCMRAALGCGILVGIVAILCTAVLVFYVVVPPENTTILILGSDARPDDPDAEAARTDSIMVVSVNPQGRVVSMLSVPRDVFIDSPTYGNLRANTVVRNAELDQPGTGIDEMVATIENTFEIDVDHHTWVSFEAFVEVVDALGGIEIDVPKRIVDNTYPTPDGGTMRIEFEPGEQTMDGATALIYSRTRHADDDFQRASRQQQVIDAVIDAMLSPQNVPRWPLVLGAMLSNVDTDMNILNMMGTSPGLLLYGSNPERLVIDREYLIGGANGREPNMERLRPWIEENLE